MWRGAWQDRDRTPGAVLLILRVLGEGLLAGLAPGKLEAWASGSRDWEGRDCERPAVPSQALHSLPPHQGELARGWQGGTQESNQGGSWNLALHRERNLPWDCSLFLRTDSFCTGQENRVGVPRRPSSGGGSPHSRLQGSSHSSVPPWVEGPLGNTPSVTPTRHRGSPCPCLL